jgi:hypothetical protein
MIVITRNGKTTVVTGWRAWIVGAFAVLVTWLVLAVVAIVLVGAAATVGLFLLLAVPAVAVAAIVGLLMNKLRP